jgi:hypothetical protein
LSFGTLNFPPVRVSVKRVRGGNVKGSAAILFTLVACAVFAPAALADGSLLSGATTPVVSAAAPVSATVAQVTETILPAPPPSSTSGPDAAPVVSASAEAAAPVVGAVANTAAPAVEIVAQTAAPAVEVAAKTTAPAVETASKAAAPIVKTASRTAAPVVKPVGDAAAPVVRPLARVTTRAVKATAPVLRAAAPVVKAARPLLDAAAPVVAAAGPLLGAAGPVTEAAGPILTGTAPLLGSRSRGGIPGALLAKPKPDASFASASATSRSTEPGIAAGFVAPVGDPATVPAAAGSASSRPESLAVPVWGLTPDGVALGTVPRRVAMVPPARLPVVHAFPGPAPGAQAPPVAPRASLAPAAGTSASTAPAPTRHPPGGPLGALSSAAAAAGGGAFVPLLAALAAAFLLAAPWLGRRLRPALAPWPLSIPRLSLERPG